MPRPKKTAAERAAARRLVLYLRFAAVYVSNGRNGTQAYMATHRGVQPNSAATQAGEWLGKPEVQDEIQRLTNEAWGKEAMGAQEVLARMARIARMDIGDYYWKPGELNAAGEPTVVGQRKPLSELTDAQRECVKGYKYSTDGLVIQEHWDKPAQLSNVAKHLKLLNDKVDVTVSVSLDKLLEQSYGQEQS